MQARYHAISGAVAAALLIPVLGADSVIFLASSVLIDGDHYLDYLCRNRFRDFGVKRMFAFHEYLLKNTKPKDLLSMNLGHTAEFLLLLYGATALTDWLWLKAVLWGMLYHMVWDLVYLAFKGRLFSRSFSITDYVVRWNSRKRRGLDPQLPYDLAVRAASRSGRSRPD